MFDQPLTFKPLYQTRVWGGRRLEKLLGRALPDATTPYGESWEISDRPDEQSLLSGDGVASVVSLHDLWTHHRQAVFGEALLDCTAPRYPLLMKILDACDDLSIQVHPPAAAAVALGGEPKTEMWFIAHAEPGARIYAGLRPGLSRADFEAAIHAGAVADCVHVLEPKSGDCLFLPSGRIHAIGAGLLIYEIQQNSDTTYRVFDWNRAGLDGKPRDLHVQESLASIDFTDFAPEFQPVRADGILVSCDLFEVRRVAAAPAATRVGGAGEHVTLAVVSGALTLGGRRLQAGDFALVPACLAASARDVQNATPDAQWLEIRLPRAAKS